MGRVSRRFERMRKWGRSAALAIAAAALAVPAALSIPGAAHAASAGEQLEEVFRYIAELHVSETSAQTLRDAAVQGMLEALDDPYTVYYDPEAWQELQDAYEQMVVGIGIRFVKTEDGLLILRVYEHSAAEAAGLRAGDIVLRVGGKSVKSHTLDELYGVLQGPEGSEARLEVVDGTTRIIRAVSLLRKPFHIPSVDYAMMEGGTGYIRIDSFSSDTADLVGEALDSFAEAGGWKALLIDVRGNPGGYLESVRGVATRFIERGALMHTVGRGESEETVWIGTGAKISVPIAVLIDGRSASASEVFAGAMQDYKAAAIVGTRTYGKGSVQQLIELQTGGGLKITVEQYLTPMRRPVNGVGIAPDVVAPQPLGAVLAALREVGAAGRVRVELKSYESVVNGAAFDNVVRTIRAAGRTYVSARSVAELIGGSVQWDAGAGAVQVRAKLGSAAFGPDTGLLLQDGASYIELTAIGKAFPEIRVSESGTIVVLEWNENG